jgi:ADP-ribosylglycohydrolase
MGQRFLAWSRDGLWTPHGEVFDIGITTRQALARIGNGVRAEVAGADHESSNGNGSLMRIIPVALRFAAEPIERLLDRVHRGSAITHRHPRSQMACGMYSCVVRHLLSGQRAPAALASGFAEIQKFYEADAFWAIEMEHFTKLGSADFTQRPEAEIESGGYVLHTLTASLWCLLNTKSYDDCVLKAVNLGGDTDTTGCVAGGLAGVLYGVDAVPLRWRNALARRDEIAQLFDRFVDQLTGA